jgi:hypothetical protein
MSTLRILGCIIVGVAVGMSVSEVQRIRAFKKAVEIADAEREEWGQAVMHTFGVRKGSPHSSVFQMLMRAMEDEEIIKARRAAAQSNISKDL